MKLGELIQFQVIISRTNERRRERMRELMSVKIDLTSPTNKRSGDSELW